MSNIKISDLNRANRISDEALVVIVQDNANKVVTVKELAEKINHPQNRLIAKLHDEIDQASQGGTINKLKDITAKQEYRLDRQQDTLNKMSVRLADASKKVDALHNEIGHFKGIVKKCEVDNAFTRKTLAYTNMRMNELDKNVHHLGHRTTYLSQYIGEVENNTQETFSYIGQFIHRTRNDYWGTLETQFKFSSEK